IHDDKPDTISPFRKIPVFAATALLIATIPIVIGFAFPQIDQTANALRPKTSEAYATLDEIKNQLAGNRDPIWLIAQGRNENEIIRHLETAQPLLDQAVSNRVISAFTLPTLLWPRVEHQSANRPVAAE